MTQEQSIPQDSAALVAMCVDDSEFDLMLNERILVRSGAFSAIHKCTGGEEALEFIRNSERPVDVIFLDINMPLMNGFEFLAAATEEFGDNFAGGVVIMLTSSLNPDDRSMAEKYAAVCEFLSKPMTVEDARTVAEHVREIIASEKSD